VNAAPLTGTSESSVGGLLVLEEVTRIKEIEKIRQDFITNASHELRTPAAAIKGFVETLQDGAIEDTSQAKKFLDAVSRNTDRLTDIVDELLTFSSVEQDAREGKIRPAWTSLAILLEDCARSIREEHGDKGVEIIVDCPGSAEANLDKRLFFQAIIRLLENAVKASEPGTEVRIVCEKTDDAIEVHVIDRGAGIPREHLDRIFERFYRKDKSRSRAEGGVGIGLAVVKHAVKAHGGAIKVESEPGVGSTFTISLPLGS
jgi:two-component system phosphate regulon sensor histidine kinase PhoR